MSSFDLAIPVIMHHEGGWVNDPADSGGETNFGWSMRTILQLGLTPKDLGINAESFSPGSLKLADRVKCQELYRIHFWNKVGCGNITDQTVATKVFDASVNIGPQRACKLAQQAANACGQSVSVDGDLGPKSYKAINSIESKTFMEAYAKEMSDFYLGLIATKPKLAKFKKNWLGRASWGV